MWRLDEEFRVSCEGACRGGCSELADAGQRASHDVPDRASSGREASREPLLQSMSVRFEFRPCRYPEAVGLGCLW